MRPDSLQQCSDSVRHPKAALEGWSVTQVGYSRLDRLKHAISGKPAIGRRQQSPPLARKIEVDVGHCRNAISPDDAPPF